MAELTDVGRVEVVIVRAARILGLLEDPVEAGDGGEWIAFGGGGAERSDHDEAVRSEMLHQGPVLSAPAVGP
jgi:hypothetical protein